jgi:hypothetical protein
MKLKLMNAVLAGVFAEAGGAAAVETAGAAPATPTPVGTNGATPPAKKEIPPSPIAGTIFKPTKYHFKKDEVGEKRPTVDLLIPVPTMEGFITAMQDETRAKVKVKNEKGEEVEVDDKLTNGEKVQNLVLELLTDLVATHGRLQVTDEKNPVNKQEELDLNKLTLAFIANIPPSERRGGGISKETWADFFKDYVEVMLEKTGKKKEQVENAAKLLVSRLQPVKTQKKILAFLKDQLNLWFSSTTPDSQEEFAEVQEFLTGKIEEFMKRDEAELLANL